MDIKIRKATVKDLESIQILNGKLCLNEHKKFDYTVDSNFPFSKQGKTYFLERITKKNGCVLVALENKKIIGYIAGGITKQESYRTIEKLAEAENMFILEDFRNKGVGSELLDKFVDWCKSKNVNRIKVISSSANSKSISFYNKNGFSDYNLVLEKII
jgi:GNAT superfamily N-acetyltransferase